MAARQTSEAPGWGMLAKQLLALPRTGREGFEGLVAKWLSQLLSERFYVASSGRQRLGDATSPSFEVGIQAKLYGGDSRPRAVEIRGDLATLASSLPHLQVYVLAATVDLPSDRFEEIELASAREGIDFVFLGLSENRDSELGVLAVSFWPEVTSRFLRVSSGMAAWAARESQSAPVKSRLAEIRAFLAHSIRSKRALALRSRELALGKLFPPDPRPPSGTSVDATRLVERRAVHARLDEWWASPARPLLVTGEEGLGKSWAVASWLRARGEELGLPVVWLDSHRWQRIHSLEQLAEQIASALCGEFYPRPEHIQRMVRKVTSRWPPPACLVVLDGANEGDAPTAANQILKQYLDEEGSRLFATSCKLVMTTRPPDAWMPPSLRRACAPLEVPPLTLEELDEGVQKASDGALSAAILPEPLREMARRARYLELSLVLHRQLGDLSQVTVKAVLFARLRQVMQENAELLGDGREFEVFADLIRLTSPPADPRAPEPGGTLDQIVPNGTTTLHDLRDAAWIEEVEQGRQELNEDHVRLGWALFFLRFAARQRLDHPLTQRIEELRAVQEPGLNDDLRSSALGAALELLTSGLAARDGFATAALLGTWVLSHNSNLQGPTFAAILGKEPDAYCQAVEALIELTGELPWEEQITEPLADAWREGRAEAAVLRHYLTRWLLFVWNASDPADGEMTHEDVQLPRASSLRLLHLEDLAIGILAHRPDLSLLRTLCRQAGSWELSRDEDGMPYKDYWRWSGALMRWGFGEQALQELEAIATDPWAAPFEVLGARRLAGTLRQVRLPESLRETSGRRRARARSEDVINQMRAGRPILHPSIQPAELGSRHWPEEIASLAADPSVPDLQAADLAVVKEGLESLIRNHDLWDGPAPGSPDLALEAWLPWVARLDRRAWADLLSQLIDKALGYPDPHYLLGQLPALLPWPAEGPLSKNLPREVRAILAKPEADSRDSKLLLWNLMRIAVHLQDKTAVRKCVAALGRRKDPAEVINILPLPGLFRYAVDPVFFEEAGHQLAKKLRKPVRLYWLWIQAACAWTWPRERRLAWFSQTSRFAGDLDATGRLLLDFLLDINDPSVLVNALQNPDLRRLLEEPYFRFEAAEWARRATRIELPQSYESLVEGFLLESIGPWLLAADRTDDFRRWGRDLFSAMSVQAEQSDQRNDEMSWVEWTDGSELRRARVLKDQRGIFEAKGALKEWARREPSEFRERLTAFLERVQPPYRRYWKLTGFAQAVAEAWLEVEPSRAHEWLKRFEEGTHQSSLTNGVPSAIYQLWNLKFCETRGHQDLRRNLLRSARNEAEIAGHVLAARMHGSLAELDRIIEPLRKSRFQLDRVLAVSILAWHPQGEGRLARLERRDPSRWVRQHTAWALEVCRQDRLGRETYRKALAASDVLHQQALLQQLAPLMMPTFEVWRTEDRVVSELEQRLDSQRSALLLEFRGRAQTPGLSQARLFGRELTKHCRGENISDYSGLGRRLLPWW